MSMGFLIALSGHKRFASNMATYMYHGASWSANGLIGDIEIRLEELKRLNKIYNDKVLEKSKLTEDQLNEKVDKKIDWFISADEAFKLSLFDEYI